MRIFLTGGTGYIGSAVLEAFVRAGHQVDALVRNRERASEVQARGARPVLGELTKPSSYAAIAAAADGVVHAAAEHSSRQAEVDKLAIETLLAAPTRPGRFMIYTSGVWVLGPCPVPADERTPVNPIALVVWRAPHEQRVLEASANGVRTAVIRPGIVYGGSRGIVGDIFKDAANGLVRVVGSGENRWPLVYDRDLGELYVRIAAHPTASGIFHANDEGDERVNDLVAAIAGQFRVRPGIRRIPIDEARAKLGAYADALALDQVVRSPRARALGWTPTLGSVARNIPRLFEEWREAA